jgi:hypothetical protein
MCIWELWPAKIFLLIVQHIVIFYKVPLTHGLCGHLPSSSRDFSYFNTRARMRIHQVGYVRKESRVRVDLN